MIRSVSNNIIYDNESKIKKLHSKMKIKEIIIPIIRETKCTENEDKMNEEFEKDNHEILSHRANSILSNKYYPIQEKIIVLNNRYNHFDEEKKNDLSQTMDFILLNKNNNINNLKVENKELKIDEDDLINDSNKIKKDNNNNFKLNNIKIDKNILNKISNLQIGKNEQIISKTKKLTDNNMFNEKNKIKEKFKNIHTDNLNKNLDENISQNENKILNKTSLINLKNNNNIIQKQNNFSYDNKENSKQIIDMKQFSFGKKKDDKKLGKRLSKNNISKFILNDTLTPEIKEVNIFIKYLFNIIGISYELSKISSNMNFNDLTFLSKKDLESLGFGIISRNRLCNIVKNFSKFLKDKKENFDLSNNNKNLKHLYEFLYKNKEIIVDKNIFYDLEKNYNNYMFKKKKFLDSQFKKTILNKIGKKNFNKFPIKTLSKNRSTIDIFILEDKNYSVTKGEFNKSKLYNNNNKLNFKNNKMKLYNAYYKLNKEVEKYFNKEKERVLLSLKKIEQI